MSGLPSGAVTFLFTDIEGSTRLLKQLRDRWSAVLAEHQRLLREAFKEHRGHEVDTQGDSFFVAFGSARDAVLAAVEGQLALVSHPWPQGIQLKVRMGIHTGQAVEADGRYTGLAVHRAARIGAAAHGGQVLVSQATQTLLEDEEEDLHLFLRDLGEQRLKDLDRPVRLYQVAADGLVGEFPPLRQEAHPAHAAIVVPFLRRRRLLAGIAALAVATAVLAAFALTRSGGAGVTVHPNSLGAIDPKQNKVVAAIANVGARPGPVAADGARAIWVGNEDDRTIARIDPRTGQVVRTIALQNAIPTGVAVGAGVVWVAHGLLGTVSRIDPQFETVQTIDTHAGRSALGSIAVGDGAVWVAFGNSVVKRLDPRSGRVLATAYAGGSPTAVTVDANGAWIANAADNNVYGFSPSTNAKVATVSVSRKPVAITAGGGAIWVADEEDDAVTRIDPRSLSTITIPVGSGPDAIAYGEGAVWVANGEDGTISRIDPATRRVVASIRVGSRPQGVVTAAGKVWFTVQAP